MPEESDPPDLAGLVLGFAAAPSDLEPMLKLFAQDAVWEGVPLGLRFCGVKEIRSFLTDWIGSYQEYEIQPREIREFGEGVVLALVDQVVRPAGSTTGTPIREAWAFVFVWAGPVVGRVFAYQDIDEARAVAERLAQERGES
jgi:ketosteroid isomerase-like protein